METKTELQKYMHELHGERYEDRKQKAWQSYLNGEILYFEYKKYWGERK